MDQSSLCMDEDQDSLFGSPPPTPARGRSPSQETLIAVEEIGPITAIPSMGACRKNVGTIALPGSHMSCAELPADLPASSLSLFRPASSHGTWSTAHSISGTPIPVHTPATASGSSTCSVPSRASSTASNLPPAAASTRKRRTPKAKSLTPVPPAPPITFPGPNEPTPPNLLRSQSSLLGLAGLVGCVKPAQLYTHSPQLTPIQQSRSHSPIYGSTPTHPIVLDDDQDTSHTEKHPCSQLQIPQRLDQLNPEILRSNIMNTLTKDNNIFPVLESLVKLLGGEPHPPSAAPPPQPFARPYRHGIFNAQPPSPAPPLSATGGSTATFTIPQLKRRKLKHVPAGAIDWDVPFPFATGEGPEAYRDTWARDRAKQLVTQLLELVQNATKRAVIKTAKGGEKTPGKWTGAKSPQLSRGASVETQIGQLRSTQSNVGEYLSYANSTLEGPATGTPTGSLSYYLSSSETPRTISSPAPGTKDGLSVDSDGMDLEGDSAVPYDYAAFEEWLSQLQQFVPSETNEPTPESDRATRLSVPLDSSASTPTSNTLVPMQSDALTTPHAIRDEAIDPTLLAMSQEAGPALQLQSPTSMLVPDDVPQVLDRSSAPPTLAHSPRTSLSSLTEPLTPLSDAFADVPTSTILNQDPVRDLPTHQAIEKNRHSRPANQIQAGRSSSPTEPRSEVSRITAAQKGKARADVSIASAASSALSRSTSGAVSTSKGVLDKQAILERARERRSQLVAEIERAKVEMQESSIENAVLVHFMRDESLQS